MGSIQRETVCKGELKMKEIKELLPIGSVVLLKNGIKKLVIIGILQRTSEQPSAVYDYLGVLYPEGYINEETKFLFNHEDINDIVHVGYSSPEREEFLELLKQL